MATNDDPKTPAPAPKGFVHRLRTQESVAAKVGPVAPRPVNRLEAWVCLPCGRLLGTVQGSDSAPKCCGGSEFVAKVDARSIQLDANGNVAAATHL